MTCDFRTTTRTTSTLKSRPPAVSTAADVASRLEVRSRNAAAVLTGGLLRLNDLDGRIEYALLVLGSGCAIWNRWFQMANRRSGL